MGVYYAMSMSDAVESYLREPPMLVLLPSLHKRETRKKEITSPYAR